MTWENRLIFEVSSADPDAVTPVWVDLTTRIRDQIQPVTSQSGRQNDLDQSEPGRLDLLLENSDDALTYGNTASPYAAWWGPGRKCRLRETVAGVVMDRFTGYLQMPTEVLVTAGIEQRVSITATDRLGRLASDEPFTSALGAYILSTTDLQGYFPMTDAAAPFRGIGPSTDPMVVERRGGAQVLPGQGVAPPGGEGSALRLLTAGFVSQENAWISLPIGFLPDVGVTDSVTVVMWIAVTGTASATQKIMSTRLIGTGQIALDLDRDLSAGTWTLAATGVMTATITAGAVGTALFPVGIRFTMSPANMELWIGGQRFTTTPAGIPQVGEFLSRGEFGFLSIDFDISHVQVYIGQTYAYSDFQAQIIQGYTPLERQTTGARIRTIAAYAGIPTAELTQIDTGSSVMQAATLAGKTPLTAMRDAERTEQGLLYVDGSGSLVFKDRRTLYNI